MKFYMESLCRPRAGMAKILLVMKLIVILLTTAILQVSASTYGQNVTLKQNNAPLSKVLDEIRKQTGYDFFYSEKVMDSAKPANVNLNNVGLLNALEILFKDQPLTYVIENKTVTIKAKEKSFLDNVIARFDKIDIRGRVVGEQNKGLSGATISIRGGNKSTNSDANGNFYLANVDERAMLVISFIGYVTKVVSANSNLDELRLELSNSKLDEIQVIAYGTTSRRLNTSNISSVKGSDIAKSSSINPLLAIAGRVPGVFITQSSGLSNTAVNVVVQGKNSLANNNLPFYVIDGVPYNSNTISSPVMGGGIDNGLPSALSFINPNDIESIELLKDGDATAIYGARAANGAILISTKKGKAGQTKVDLNLQSGWGSVGNKFDLLNTSDYLQLRKEAYLNANQNLPTSPAASSADLTIWDQNRYTNWQEELIGGTAHFQNFQSSISGGNQSTQFLISGSYRRQTTVFPGDFSNVNGNIRFNLNHTSSNGKFRINLSSGYLQGENRLPQTDLTSFAVTLPPNAPALYNNDGTLNWEPLVGDPNSATFDNPIAKLLAVYSNKVNNLIGSGQISYSLFPSLKFTTTFGFNKLANDETGTVPVGAINPNNRSFIKRNSSFANKNTETWILEPQITYNKIFSFGTIDALVGTTFQQTSNYMRSYKGDDFSNDNQLENIFAAPIVTALGALDSYYRYGAIFGRVNYNYADRYILNLSARRDGSSRFGSENLFHSFYSVGGAWLFSNEHLIKSNFPVLSFGKIRASYGTTGNDGIGDYRFLSLYEGYPTDRPYQGISTLTANGLPNPYLQWEETRKINFGIELGFFKDRIILNTNFFRNRSSNQLVDDELSQVTGFATITRNRPALVQNKGLEFALDISSIRKKNFSWNSSLNVTVPKNKLLRYDDLSPNNIYYTIGKSTSAANLYRFAGVNLQTGLYEFVKKDGTLSTNPNDEDLKVIVDLNPRFYGGLTNTFTYKEFTFDFLLQFTKQTAAVNNYPVLLGYSMGNQLSNVLDRWKTPGDLAKIQKVTRNVGEIIGPSLAIGGSDAAYRDASYIRMRNISLSYSLPDNLLDKIHFSGAKIFLQGQNLYTIKGFSGVDPETLSKLTLPPLRVCMLGIQLTL